LGKYPIKLNEKFTFYPLLGAEYQISLLERRQRFGGTAYDRTDVVREADSNGNAFKLSAWNAFLINLGAGVDYYFTPSLFLKTEFLYGFRLMTEYEQEMLETAKNMINNDNPTIAGLTSGPTLKIAVGWKFL
jgi:hypothetical protein